MRDAWFEVLFILMVFIVVGELLLSSTWNQLYFTLGVVIFRRQYRGIPITVSFPTAEDLQAEMKGRWSHSIVFKAIGTNQYAFREKLFEFTLFHATPVMHGLLWWSPESGTLNVEGRPNWFIIGFVILWVAGTIGQAPFMILCLLVVIGILYAIQMKRFEKVGMMAAEKYLKA